ncbi:HAD hydrolase-like protein, partial [Streptococcus sp.]
MNLKGIIFDMDGVIVDTEYQDFLIQKDFIKHLNPKSSYEDSELLVLVGKSYFNLYRLLQQFIGKQYDIKTIEKEYASFSDERYEKIDYSL